MIARILLPLDKSRCSRQAAGAAARIAQQHGASITALALLSGYALSRAEVWKAHRDLEAAYELVKEEAAQCGVLVDLRTSERLPVDAMLEEATRHDLIVAGRDAGFWDAAERTPSAVVEGLLSRAPRPVLLTGPQEPHLERLLAAFDGSNAASETLHLLALLGLGMQGTIDVMSIDADGAHALQLARAAADLFRAHGAASIEELPVVSKSDPAQVLLARAESKGAGIIAMGAYGNGGLRELFFGSCTRRILESSQYAVFVHH